MKQRLAGIFRDEFSKRFLYLSATRPTSFAIPLITNLLPKLYPNSPNRTEVVADLNLNGRIFQRYFESKTLNSLPFFYFLGNMFFRKIVVGLKEIFQCFQPFARFPNQNDAHQRMQNRTQKTRFSGEIYLVNYLRMKRVNFNVPDACRERREKRRLVEQFDCRDFAFFKRNVLRSQSETAEN